MAPICLWGEGGRVDEKKIELGRARSQQMRKAFAPTNQFKFKENIFPQNKYSAN